MSSKRQSVDIVQDDSRDITIVESYEGMLYIQFVSLVNSTLVDMTFTDRHDVLALISTLTDAMHLAWPDYKPGNDV